MTVPPVGLLDMSALIGMASLDPDTLPAQLRISAVTLAELSVGPLVVSDAAQRAKRQVHLQMAESRFDPLPFDVEAARAFGRVVASLRQQGRKTSARTYDAMIAATALAHGIPVLTLNPRDFEGIDGLEVIALGV